ncbi:cytochrome P450 [Actinophytocola xanthii]|uniref:Cytochrome n=1 Tax=Actinophytocola xanthii TaxID=1912961 RepID=A0A1Q8CW40_9PSEU|nr:cytochrome P450 [Actinophytocola xanthii]OLF18571.1 cytochrome [Actinophytocola xanthii]
MTEQVAVDGIAGLPTERSAPFDPPAELARLRARHPVTPLRYPDGHVGWLVTGHAAARAVLSDARFSARLELKRLPVGPAGAAAMQPAPPGYFLGMDPPDHTRYRKLLAGRFTARRMRELEERIGEVVDECLDDLAGAEPPVDLVERFALPVPSRVMCELLGVPYEDRAHFQSISEALLGFDVARMEAAFGEINAYLYQLVVRKRAERPDDLLGDLISQTDLDDVELCSIAFLLLVAGHETSANMLGIGTFALLANPDQLAALRADPALLPGAVDELLRYLSIPQYGITRTALADVELAGCQVREGDVVTVSVPAVNRDPERFPDPDTLDVTRSAAGHVTFGHGVHQCIGQALALVELRLGFGRLLERFPTLRLAVPAAEVPMRADRQIYGVHRLPVAW